MGNSPQTQHTPAGYILDPRYSGLPDCAEFPAPDGHIMVQEPVPPWSSNGTARFYCICIRPKGYPHHHFYGPPLHEPAMPIDPTGYFHTTPEGIRLHRDGWLVTKDGLAFPAEARLKDVNLSGDGYIIIGPVPAGLSGDEPDLKER